MKFRSNKDFASRIQKGWDVFDTYYCRIDVISLYTTALILHPARRTKYIKTNWPAKWVKPNFKKVEKLWEDYREKALAPSLIISYDEVQCKPEEEKELDAFDRIGQDLGKYMRPSSQDEYGDYTDQPSYDIGKMSALVWWG